MIGLFRSFLNTWAARLFFALLTATFVVWGVGDVVRNLGNDGSIATVAGHRIEMPEVQDAYRRQLAQVTRMLGTNIEPTPEIRRGVAAQALDQVITTTAVNTAIANMGITVPDDALRQAVWDMAPFKGPDGKFSRAQFEQLLRSNGYTEGRFLELMRADLAQRQLANALRAGYASPDTLTRIVYAFQREQRVADMVELAFAAVQPPAPPTEAQLQRWYENHPDLYRTPEFRRIRAVVLAPARIAADIQVGEDEVKAAYEQRRASFEQPERRDVQVILTPDEAAAKTLAEKWLAGADWAAIQEAAKAANGTPVELTGATREEIPAPELAEAAFAAKPGEVPAPVKSALGWHVLKVTKVVPGAAKTLDEMREPLKAQIALDKAADLAYDRANKIEDLLAGGTKLEDLPGDFGLAAIAGTLDAQGMTPEGQPAPIPGGDALRQALIQAAFAAKPGDPPRLIEAPRQGSDPQSFFAVEIESIQEPKVQPMDQVAARVKEDWTHDAIRHIQDEAAAKLLAAVKGGQSLADAAAAAGLKVTRLPATGRAAPAEGVPAQLMQPLFELKKGEPTMVETPDGFVVAQLADIIAANADQDALGYAQARDALTQSLGNDLQAAASVALRDRGNPKINRAMADQIVQGE